MDRQGDELVLDVEKMLWEWESLAEESARDFSKRSCSFILIKKRHEFLTDFDGKRPGQ